MNKKFLCVVLALCFVISLLPAFSIGAGATGYTTSTVATSDKLYSILSELSSAPSPNTDYVITTSTTTSGFYNQSSGLVQVHLGATPDPTESTHYIARGGDITYDVDNAAQSSAFQSLFDACGGTLAYNPAGCQYSCMGGAFKNVPVHLYTSTEFTLTSIAVTYASSYYPVGTSASKSMISSITGTYTNGSDTVTAPMDISGSGWSLAAYHSGGTTGSTFTDNSDQLQVTYDTTTVLGDGPNLGYIVSFNANGGSGAPSSQTKVYGTDLALSTTEPTQSGYTFQGWGTSSEATIASYLPGDIYTANSALGLYAIWRTSGYNVTYNANGSGVTGLPSTPQTKTYDVALTIGAAPSRTGYDFMGWATSAAGPASYQPGDAYVANAAINFYAVWRVSGYTVTYNANDGGDGSSVSGLPSTPQTKTSGVPLTIGAAPSRTGYSFVGWGTSSDATVPTYQPGESYSVDADLDLFAVWEMGTYTITYDANEGSNTPASQTKDYGDTTFKLTSSVPTRDGYDFVKWNTVRDGSGTDYLSGATYADDANLYLYARWTAKTYTITYNANGAGVTNMPAGGLTKTYGTTFTLSSTVPVRTGYTFRGWAVSNTSVIADYAAGADYTLNADLILYAVWEVNTYTVTFHANNGDVHNPGTTTDITVANMPTAQTVAYGSKAAAPTAPTTAYYVLEGWYTEADCTNKWDFNVNTMAAANVDLYAKWQVNYYTVTFVVAAIPTTRDVSWTRGNIGATSNELYVIKGGSIADAVGSYSDPVCTTMDDINDSEPAYTFGGWLTSSNSTWDFNSVVTSNLTLTANWVPNGYYTVTFDFNHGAVGANTSFTVIVKGGDKILVPSSYPEYVAPERTGYTLNGWYTDSTVGTPCNFDTKIVTAPLTVYAGWFTKGIEFQTATGTNEWSGAGIYKDYFQEELYTAFEDGITYANDSVDVTYAVLGTGDALPSGLYLDAQTGVIYGVPTVTGTFSINIRATNSGVGATNGAKYASTTIAIVIENRDVTVDLNGTYTNHKIYGQDDDEYNGEFISVAVSQLHKSVASVGSTLNNTVDVNYTYGSAGVTTNWYAGDTHNYNSTDTFTISVSRAVGEDVGTYKIYLLDSKVSVSGESDGTTKSVKGFYDFTYPADLTALTISGTTPAKYIYTINKRDIQIEAIRGSSYVTLSKVYGEDDNITERVKPVSAFLPTVKVDTKAGDYGLTGWSVTDINGTVTPLSDSLTGNLYRPAGETVATYPLTVGYTDGTYVYTLNTKNASNVVNTTNYNFLSNSAGSLTITAKPITVRTTYNGTATETPSKTYGTDDNIGFSVTSGSLVTRVAAGETDNSVLDVMGRHTAIDDVWSGAIYREEGEDVGEYPLMMIYDSIERLFVITNGDATKASRTSNYAVTFDTNSHLTITKKLLTVEAVPGTATKVYGTDDALTARVNSSTPLVHGVTVTDTWGRETLINDVFVANYFERDPGENVGSYDIDLGTTGINSPSTEGTSTYTNYDVTLGTTTFTITQKALALTASFAVGSVPTNGVVSYDKFTGNGLVSRTVKDVNGNNTPIADVLTAGVYSTLPSNQITAGTYALASSTLHEDTPAAVGSHTANYTLSNVTVTIYMPSFGGGSSGFTVTYDAGTSGTIPAASKTETVASGSKPVNVPTVTPTTGLVFKGWTLDGSAAVPADTVITKDVTFVAVYAEHKCAAFTDIAGHWAFDSICYVTENDMFNGTSATTFSPNATMTRAMFVTVLYRMAGSPAITGSNPFSEDVAAEQWYTNAVVFAANNGIVKGTSETTYSPDAPITREQMAVILYNYAVYRGYSVSATNDLSAFSDASSVSSWALTQTKWAVAKGLITGMTTTTLEPQGDATRAQVATILTRFVKTIGA